MDILKVLEDNINERHIDAAVEALENNELIIYPTDTIYALGCNALNNAAINKLCKLKGINTNKTNLSIICDSISMAAEYAHFDNRQFKMLKANTPGPFTFIFPASATLPKAFKGRKTVGIRIPDNKIALELVRKFGGPILTTTIEFEDEDYAINPELIAERYDGEVLCLLDGGDGGLIPSTVVDCCNKEIEIIREGKGELII